jgi:hypothetical protein
MGTFLSTYLAEGFFGKDEIDVALSLLVNSRTDSAATGPEYSMRAGK